MTDVGLLRPGAHRGDAHTDDTAVLQALLDVEAAWVAAQRTPGSPRATPPRPRVRPPAPPTTTPRRHRPRAEDGGNPVLPLVAGLGARCASSPAAACGSCTGR